MPQPIKPQPVTLQGRYVRLLPLAASHCDALVAAVRDGELWILWYTTVPAPEQMSAEIERRLVLAQAGSMVPFTVMDAAKDEIVGMTAYMAIDAPNRRLQIGSTWYAHRVQRTALNTEAKFLLLAHAFESLGCIAVEFRTHWMNQASRRAIERLGAKLDGVLRSHSFAKNGTVRDTCVYSILAGEWPAVRAHLSFLLERKCPAVSAPLPGE